MASFAYQPRTADAIAAAAWGAGHRDAAVRFALAALARQKAPTADAFVQPAYYLFILDRYEESAEVLQKGLEQHPDHAMTLLLLGASLSRGGRHRQAIPILERFLDLGNRDAGACDALAASCCAIGDLERARAFGEKALHLKDEAAAATAAPPLTPVRPGPGQDVIAFTLFGSQPRYLRGALHNQLVAKDLYPGWTCRFYVDASVDADLVALLDELGAQIVMDDSRDEDPRHRLTCRFLVSDDPGVARFLVRDCDSVISPREAEAVGEWVASGEAFHVMRDWYTHTDPMLAGMWGGFAGLLPAMAETIASFRSETALLTNWDQWFLRERVWPQVRGSVMVHDRLFAGHRSRPFPGAPPPIPEHVGQDEHGARGELQAERLRPFAKRVPALALDC